jgi:peptide/nickel transport system ATP-binding protein
VCDSEPPPARDAGGGHVIHCHIPLAELRRVTPIFRPAKQEERHA